MTRILLVFLIVFDLWLWPRQVFCKTKSTLFVVSKSEKIHGVSYQVWSVESSGQEKLVKKFDADLMLQTGTEPVVSPDGTKLAYTHNYNLWVWDAATDKTIKINNQGAGEDGEYLTVHTLIDIWSMDSNKILYTVQNKPILISMDTKPRPGGPLKVKPVECGSFLFDLNINQSVPVTFRPALSVGSFYIDPVFGLDSDNEILLRQPEPGFSCLKFIGKDGAVHKTIKLLEDNYFTQILLGANKDEAICLLSRTANKKSELTKVVRMDLKSGKWETIRDIETKSNCSYPCLYSSLSPSAGKVAWIESCREENSKSWGENTLKVDDKKIYKVLSPWSSNYKWINDEAIVLRDNGKLMVISVEDGKILGQAEFKN